MLYRWTSSFMSNRVCMWFYITSYVVLSFLCSVTTMSMFCCFYLLFRMVVFHHPEEHNTKWHNRYRVVTEMPTRTKNETCFIHRQSITVSVGSKVINIGTHVFLFPFCLFVWKTEKREWWKMTNNNRNVNHDSMTHVIHNYRDINIDLEWNGIP